MGAGSSSNTRSWWGEFPGFFDDLALVCLRLAEYQSARSQVNEMKLLLEAKEAAWKASVDALKTSLASKERCIFMLTCVVVVAGITTISSTTFVAWKMGFFEAPKHAPKKDERQEYPQPQWLKTKGVLNIAVVGNSGVGKSLFINALRGLKDKKNPGWASVGVNETTTSPQQYPVPGTPGVYVWDLPGAGTENFPAKTYIQDMGLRYFDVVIIIQDVRFTQTDKDLYNECVGKNVPFFFVRSKIDKTVEDNKRDNGCSETETLKEIGKNMALNGLKDFFLISSAQRESYQFPELVKAINDKVQEVRGLAPHTTGNKDGNSGEDNKIEVLPSCCDSRGKEYEEESAAGDLANLHRSSSATTSKSIQQSISDGDQSSLLSARHYKTTQRPLVEGYDEHGTNYTTLTKNDLQMHQLRPHHRQDANPGMHVYSRKSRNELGDCVSVISDVIMVES